MQETLEKRVEKKQIRTIDFNCDIAQSFGVYKNIVENDLLDYVSSVNISCGFHAGDPLTIKNALLNAKEHHLAIGAHIGYNDIQGFGYRAVDMTEDEIEALVIYQVGSLMTFAKAFQLEVEHVRLHGAMYKLAATDFTFACTVAKAIQKCSQWLVYVGAVGDVTQKVGEYLNIPTAQEIQLDTVYNSDLTADFTKTITDTDRNIRRLQHLLRTSQLDNNEKGFTFANVDTIHFSNKFANSLELAKRAREIIEPTPLNYNKVKASGWVE